MVTIDFVSPDSVKDLFTPMSRTLDVVGIVVETVDEKTMLKKQPVGGCTWRSSQLGYKIYPVESWVQRDKMWTESPSVTENCEQRDSGLASFS